MVTIVVGEVSDLRLTVTLLRRHSLRLETHRFEAIFVLGPARLAPMVELISEDFCA